MRSTSRADAVLVLRTWTSTAPGGSRIAGGLIGDSVISVLSASRPRRNCAGVGVAARTTRTADRMAGRVRMVTINYRMLTPGRQRRCERRRRQKGAIDPQTA